MTELKTTRPFRERFLDGFDRSQLREEVQKTKPRRLSGLRKKYASWALGGALAIGGLGVPMKIASNAMESHPSAAQRKPEAASDKPTTIQVGQAQPAANVDQGIQNDMSQAKSIADEVAGGVTAAASGVSDAVNEVGATVAQAPQAIAETARNLAPEAAKAAFFQKEVPFGGIIYNEAKKNNLPPELVAAVVQQESKFHPTARSNRGAIGLMQLVPRTGRWMGANNLLDPTQNIQAGAKYLRYLADQFGGDQQKMIAAFNAGEGNVRRFQGIPPFRETQDYVQRVREFQRDFLQRFTGQAAPQVADLGG